MVGTDRRPSESTLFVCRDCGTSVEGVEPTEECPECGGLLRNTTVDHD
ncbi:hypothetical protein MBEHAL_0772 [Halarchaeum acidiphilum MH1-52-1]|uniref:DUF7129 domain-containing protein n=1 Tax=Halarchaeum acidiphilum MH1-52-1 TaxID=1261545 RepID=U2YTE4_9EURY|nr:rubrerythrin-like domain-containing protein [Halarchaeum acidiphilum]GAD52012.1 hypothetical protein MBEHAL_0772 [Halarchaeum acidiphilum MH1-52-1]